MRKILSAAISATVLLMCSATTAVAQEPPKFFRDSIPEFALSEILQGYGAVQGEGASLDTKTIELISLAVAAQIPCEYCVYAHRINAKKAGATESELREAAAIAGYVRLMSTMLQGAEYNLDEFKSEMDAMQ